MITIFTIPRQFKGQFDIIQRNAIKSWTLLCPKCEIILLGNEEGIAKTANEFSIRHIPKIEKNEFGTPIINDVFKKVQKAAKNKILAYVNNDIILLSNFTKAIELLQGFQKGPFLMIGQKCDLNIKEPIKFYKNDWEERLGEQIAKEGKIAGPSWVDYWILPRDLQFNYPPFTIGRPGFDSWLVYYFLSQGMPVIDATKVINVVHQNHSRPQRRKNFYKIEYKKNIKIMGNFSELATLRNADLLLTKDGLEKPPLLRMIFSKLTLFYPCRILLGMKRKIQSKI